jgi:hypothetical protein
VAERVSAVGDGEMGAQVELQLSWAIRSIDDGQYPLGWIKATCQGTCSACHWGLGSRYRQLPDMYYPPSSCGNLTPSDRNHIPTRAWSSSSQAHSASQNRQEATCIALNQSPVFASSTAKLANPNPACTIPRRASRALHLNLPLSQRSN